MIKEANGSPDLIVLGLDEQGAPHAGRFSAAQRELVEKAAKAMNLTVHQGNGPNVAELAKKLDAGRLYATGRAFLPPIRKALYDKLVEQLGGGPKAAGAQVAATAPTQPMSVQAQQLPKTWDEIGVGHMVVAHEGPKEPWFVAVVLARDGDMLTLKWRDYSNEPSVLRHVGSVALLKPAAATD